MTIPTLQPRYAAVDADRSVDLRGPAVAWMGDPMPPSAKAWQMRMEEAADVAATLPGRRRRRVGGRRSATEPYARHGSATSRCSSRPAPGSALSRRRCGPPGVPYRVEGGSLVYRTQELRDLLNRLTAIDDPSDEVAVVAALRGPGYACSDRELAEHRARGRRLQLPGA